MWGNFGLFCSFNPKLPRIHVRLHCNANKKTNREKGYCFAPRAEITCTCSNCYANTQIWTFEEAVAFLSNSNQGWPKVLGWNLFIKFLVNFVWRSEKSVSKISYCKYKLALCLFQPLGRNRKASKLSVCEIIATRYADLCRWLTWEVHLRPVFKRRILQVPNLMEMRKFYCFRSFALDSEHVKCDVWNGCKHG